MFYLVKHFLKLNKIRASSIVIIIIIIIIIVIIILSIIESVSCYQAVD